MKALNDMIKTQTEVEVIVNGKPLKEYFHEGQFFVEGREGTPFSLRFRNNSPFRKLFIPSIDGLSILDGKDASFESGGYIVRPYSTVTIDGWRKSDSEVAEFYFSSPKNSYRKRMKKGNNLGIIGVAVFDEKQIPFVGYMDVSNTSQPPYKFSSAGGSSAFYSASNLSGQSLRSHVTTASADLGTGWGQSKKSEVVTVDFERASSHPSEQFEILYNTREQLERMGVNFKKEPVYVARQAFPGQYCEPPTSY